MDKARTRLAVAFDCPLYTALAVLGGRWKPLILWHLLEDGAHGFLELHRAIHGVSKKMLVAQLRELEAAGLVRKATIAARVPRSEYSATAYARSTRHVLDALCDWGERHGETHRLAPSRQISA